MGCLGLILRIGLWLAAVWMAWSQVNVHDFWSAILFIVLAGFMYVLIHLAVGLVLVLFGAIASALSR